MIHLPSFTQRFIAGLTHVLAVDHDGCADFHVLENRLRFVTSMRTEYGLDATCWQTIHCTHDTNPLTYTSPLHDNGNVATAADLAVLWREHLHQGLYVVTTGTHGHPGGRQALHAFTNAPRLITQVRLTITSTEPTDDLVEDLRILHPLWDLPERFHLAVQATENDLPDARAAVVDLLKATGMGRVRLYTAFNDPHLISFHPTGHHDPERRSCYGIHTTGNLFSADDTSLTTLTPLPYSWDTLHRAFAGAGWTA